MKELAPRYLRHFKCIAGACRHSCCIGWEIDVDEDTLDRYRTVQGTFGKRLAENIVTDEEGAHFRLGEKERCPFLNEKGLCDIYITLGEEALCQICTDHPRYRNYFSDRCELGIGLCCEAAAELILSEKEPFFLEILWDDGEEEENEAFEELLFTLREKLFLLLQSDAPVRVLAEQMCKQVDIHLPKLDWIRKLRALEQLDPKWDALLADLQNAPQTVWEETMAEFDLPFRNLLCYFLYRHLSGAEQTSEFAPRVGFCYLAYRVICALCAEKKRTSGVCSFMDLVEFARMYSCEIEYSIENTEALLAMWEKAM